MQVVRASGIGIVRTALVGLGVVALLGLGGCSSGSSDTGAASQSPASTQSPTTAPISPFPVSKDGSIITPNGYVFKGDFAICNQAKCGDPDANGNAECTCQVLEDTWTLSPVPTSSFTALDQVGLLMSTFTTSNVTQANSVKCNEGEYADCYGALCVANEDGTATCTCPVIDENPGEWMKYVDSCSGPDVGCSADLVSAAPLFLPEGSTSFTYFVDAVDQAGDSIPGIPEACPVPSASQSQ